MRTYIPKPSTIEKKWWVVDAKDQVLGRLATNVARVLCGKHKPTWVPFLDTGDFVIVVNAAQVVITGNKLDQKYYRRHTGYPGGLKEIQAKKLFAAKPETVVKEAVWGMLPKNKLGKKMLSKLKVYAGPDHKHQAQQPEEKKF
ncbi:MAG: 50S ribosomal protein L13 [Acidobacteria bacterium]|nr:50S ribosomal protein L13 [Acidobacteriota bacterium]